MFRSALPTLRLGTTTRRRVSTLRVVESTGDRSLALPLCFVSIQRFESPSPWDEWISKFSQKGYTSLLVSLDPEPSLRSSTTSQEILSSLESEFLSTLRSSSSSPSPFPPLLFASSLSSLLAETYVSSHPLSGLVLENPLNPSSATGKFPEVFKTNLEEFNYEPFFPVAVIEEEGSEGERHRLVREFAGEEDDELVRRIEGSRERDGTWEKVMEWMDENGL